MSRSNDREEIEARPAITCHRVYESIPGIYSLLELVVSKIETSEENETNKYLGNALRNLDVRIKPMYEN
jgi:hypothetical protein